MRNKLLILVFTIIYFISNGENNKTTFGLQYKPIIPAKYFNSFHTYSSSGNYKFKLSNLYSNSFGMVLRHKINKTFLFETGLNYTQRNYKLNLSNINIGFEDFTSFEMRSYELPIQILTYVQVSEFWHLNVAFGISHNVLASDIISSGDNSSSFIQNTYRKNGGYRALIANLGMEHRTNEKGHYYFGASLHLPFTEIGRIYPIYSDLTEANNFNTENFEDKFFIELPGNFITIDFRYFFPE